MAAVTISRSGDRLIAVKSVGPNGAGAADREAQLLRRLRHPGIVGFVELVKTPEGGRALHTEFVSSETWATRPLTDPVERAMGMAALATIIADLHDTGVAHLQITAGHVLHGENDEPVVCGLSATGDATPENRRADLAGLADLCHDETLERGPLHDKLAGLADASRAGRLEARELAHRLARLANKRSPASNSRAGTSTGGPRERSPRRAKVLHVAAGAVAMAIAFGVVAPLWRRVT